MKVSAIFIYKLPRLLLAAAMSTMLFTIPASALDNPDSPDDLKAFFDQANRLENDLAESADNNQKVIEAGARYQAFLDSELNKAYQSVLQKLGGQQKTQLQQSQRIWIQYRDAEFAFIGENWTQESFGSSAQLSRAMYRSTVIRDRVEMLLNYQKNY
jgi:uncharacterized protein YecT (DUF1311 family)